jgi:hypothetical protein
MGILLKRKMGETMKKKIVIVFQTAFVFETFDFEDEQLDIGRAKDLAIERIAEGLEAGYDDLLAIDVSDTHKGGTNALSPDTARTS